MAKQHLLLVGDDSDETIFLGGSLLLDYVVTRTPASEASEYLEWADIIFDRTTRPIIEFPYTFNPCTTASPELPSSREEHYYISGQHTYSLRHHPYAIHSTEEDPIAAHHLQGLDIECISYFDNAWYSFRPESLHLIEVERKLRNNILGNIRDALTEKMNARRR